jgi:methionyl-tRNA synthetase
VNRYLNDRAPWAQIAQDPASAHTTLYVALRAVDDLKVLFAPFLPFSSQRLHEMLGYEGRLFGQQRVQTVGEGEDAHAVLRYDPAGALGRWAPGALPAGQALREPAALFAKLDEATVVVQERERLAAQSGL